MKNYYTIIRSLILVLLYAISFTANSQNLSNYFTNISLPDKRDFVLISLRHGDCTSCISSINSLVQNISNINPETSVFIVTEHFTSDTEKMFFLNKLGLNLPLDRLIGNNDLVEQLGKKHDGTPSVNLISPGYQLLLSKNLKNDVIDDLYKKISPTPVFGIVEKIKLKNNLDFLAKNTYSYFTDSTHVYNFNINYKTISKYTLDSGMCIKNLFWDSLKLDYASIVANICKDEEYTKTIDIYTKEKLKNNRFSAFNPVCMFQMDNDTIVVCSEVTLYADTVYKGQKATLANEKIILVKLTKGLKYAGYSIVEENGFTPVLYKTATSADNKYYFTSFSKKDKKYVIVEFVKKGNTIQFNKVIGNINYPKNFDNAYYITVQNSGNSVLFSNGKGGRIIAYDYKTTTLQKTTRIKNTFISWLSIYSSPKGNLYFLQNKSKQLTLTSYSFVTKQYVNTLLTEKSSYKFQSYFYFLIEDVLYKIGYKE